MLKFRPGIISRISSLIVLQVLFIFAAIVLILSDSSRDKDLSHDQAIASQLQQPAVLAADLLYPAESLLGSETKLIAFRQMLDDVPGLRFAAILTEKADSAISLNYKYVPNQQDQAGSGGEAGPVNYDVNMARFVASQEPRYFAGSVHDSRNSIYYLRLETDPGMAASVLAVTVDHGLLVSSRSKIGYAVLVLFLFSTLVSLMTVHFVSKRFQKPLEEIIQGFEETTEDELFYMVELRGDRELDRLGNAFNQMTQQLWKKHKELTHYIARLKKSNIKILEAQLFLVTLIDATPLSIVVTNSEGKIVIFNAAASQEFGYSTNEVIGKETHELFSGTQNLQLGTESSGFEALCRKSGGELFPAFVISSHIGGGDDNSKSHLLIIRDISESQGFQDMMIRLDRYYTRGEMAGDVAHEINNYLAILMGNLELVPLLLKKGKNDKVSQKLELMKTTVDKIARFSDGLMDTPQDEVHLEPASLNQMIENVVAFLKPQNKFDSIEVVTDLSPDLSLNRLDQGQIQQLLVNLLYNSAEAMAECEGDRTINLVSYPAVHDNIGYSVLEVRDTGPGVPQERVSSLFTERFTTKRKGHGIGLVTCGRIVRNHTGTIKYDYDDGAVFRIELAVDPDSAVNVPEPSKPIETAVT